MDHKPFRFVPWRCVLAMGVALAVIGPLPAQQQGPQFPAARLTSVTPPGGKAGSTVEVAVTGPDLDEATALWFSHPGLKAERLDPGKPEPPRNPQPNQPVPVTARFKVTIPADAPPGVHDVRVAGKWGISNPRGFAVGDLDEVLEKEGNNDVPDAQKVALNTTVSGVIGANTDVDYYSFAGQKGQRVLVRCAAGEIDSRANPLVQLIGPGGRELAAARRADDADAVLDCTLPDDGDYLVRVCEYAYLGGGPDYFYRLSLSTRPWLDAVFPPMVEPGKPTELTLLGRNLPGDRRTVRLTPPPADARRPAFGGLLLPRAAGVDGFAYRLPGDGGASNPVFVAYAAAPVVLDNDDNDTPDRAQVIPVPCEIAGRFEKKRDRDCFLFTAKKDEVIVFEGYADRLGSPVDLYLELRRAGSADTLAEYDDHPDLPPALGRFYTRTDDPKGRFVAPADGKYELIVRSRGGDVSAGPTHVYRVAVRREQPDFRLVLVGNTDIGAGGCTVRRGSSQDIQVVCFRQDGFTGEVVLTAEGLPAGVTCPPQVLGPVQRQTALVVTAAADAADWAGEFRVTGTAKVGDREVVHEAAAGCLVWPTPQPNIPAISRLCRALCLAVRDPGPFGLEAPVREVTVPVGGTASVPVQVNRLWPDFKGPVQLTRLAGPAQANGQPLNLPAVTIAAGQTATEIKFPVPNNLPPGSYNLVFQGTAQLPFSKDPNAKQKPNVTVAEVTPPVKLTIYSAVAEVTPGAPAVSVRPGDSAPVTVKVKRLQNYQGDFKVTLILPQGFQGISAEPATIAAGANEAQLVLKSPAGAKYAVSPDVIVRATATVNGMPVNHDARVRVTVAGDAPAGGAVTELKTVKLVADGADGWKYTAAAKVKGDKWRDLEFDDSGWKTGRAPIGYGEEEIAKRKGTQVSEQGQPVLFRRTFEVPAEVLSKKGATVRLAVASDDSAVVYLNGEVVDQDPVADHEFMYWNREVEVPVKKLRPGKNVLAVLVKNTEGSSDLYLDLELIAQVPEEAAPPKK